MVNEQMFDDRVKKSGYKYCFLAQQLDITEYGLIKKRKGKIPFKVVEINTLTKLLGLTAEDRDAIFGLESSQ